MNELEFFLKAILIIFVLGIFIRLLFYIKNLKQ